jgi:large subunit ribosomal protein L18
MNRLAQKNQNQAMRKARVHKSITVSADRPRLSVTISARHVVAQIIDDTSHKTVAYSTTVGSKEAKGTLSEKAAWVGKDIAKKATAKKVKKVVFDRNGRLYHGRIKALASAAREAGLEF